MSPVIRRATLDDLAAIMTLEQASFPTDAWSEPQMAGELRSRHGYYVVAEDSGRVIGYAGLMSLTGGTDGDVQTIAVAETARGTGLGRALFTELLDEARRRGVTDVFLEVREDNPVAQAMYRAFGFEHIATRPRYYQPDDVDALVMRVQFVAPAAPAAHRPGGTGAVGSEAVGPADGDLA
ncbi:ribosomal protein S18-alanine N-acetyltransferase [Curtobacterium sp. Leaf261]|uniref:ribosomal protein S18-alanine N-acetyltransferase n=1 Tax=Curtobacterium sp. Leaf261 TaxID=1736311 RepID=UPI0006F7339D|nr:ribosomal protein S18-alanine N-acetyltransferase [Curtobacterium sp. Leaf261]KQO63580.1 ribosomal-protein-alanine acetyltransferase [Curtobacterium sp. Leaf261]